MIESISKKNILIGLIILSFSFAIVEYLVQPPKISQLFSDNSNHQENDQLNSIISTADFNIETPIEQEEPIVMQHVSKKNFENAGILGIQIYELNITDNLFKRISLTEEVDNIKMITGLFFQNSAPFIKIYEFHPLENSETTSLYNNIYAKLQQSIEENEQDLININKTNSFGEGSFYFNNKKNYPEMVFLVIISQNKILAFEYQSNNHEKVKKLLEVLF